jgi:outer membrane protein, heavy metal efflux system
MCLRDSLVLLPTFVAVALAWPPCADGQTVTPASAARQAQYSAIPSRLTLQEAIHLAVSRNPSLAAVRNEIEAFQGDSVTASRRLNPAVSLEEENFPIRGDPGRFFGTQEITLRFDYEIERGGRRQLRTKSAQQAVEAQKLAYQDQVRRIELEVKRAFSSIVLAKSNLETSRSILEQAERMIELNRVRLKQGDISALDLNRIELEKLRFQDDVFQADLMLRNSRSSLLALLNAADLSQDVDVVGALRVTDQIPEAGLPPRAPRDELFRIALQKRPDIASVLQQKDRADTETRLQRAIRSPNLTVGGGYKRNAVDNSFVVGVTLPLQIFNRNEGGILRADAGQRRSANLEAALQKQIQLEVQQAYNAVEINRQRVEYIGTQHLGKAEDTSRVTLTAYNLGSATLMDYLDAQRTYRDALRIYNQALFDERISLYELASAIGSGVE